MIEKCFSHMLKSKKKNFSVDKEPLDCSQIEQRDVKNTTTNESKSSKKYLQTATTWMIIVFLTIQTI